MKLVLWLQINKVIPTEFANKIGVSPSLVHKYLYEDTIPRPRLMQVIYEKTHGAVTANDFYDLQTEFKQLISKNQNEDRS